MRGNVVVITGSLGLVGSAVARHFASLGCDTVGIDNGFRSTELGAKVRTAKNTTKQYAIDIRDREQILGVVAKYSQSILLVAHCAASPSHDWSGKYPAEDFAINVTGTLNLLEAARLSAPKASFIFCSSSKVYGDVINAQLFEETTTRLKVIGKWSDGITESMQLDGSMHSPYGANKLAADVLVQEYGHYYGLRTVCFRPNCITGPDHAGVPLHGFLSYLMKCAATGTQYEVHGYKGKQVRDNFHADDLVAAMQGWLDQDGPNAEAYNIGGGSYANCSILEAIEIAQRVAGRKMNYTILDQPRRGDHKWWITNYRKLNLLLPNWKPSRTIDQLCQEIYDANRGHW